MQSKLFPWTYKARNSVQPAIVSLVTSSKIFSQVRRWITRRQKSSFKKASPNYRAFFETLTILAFSFDVFSKLRFPSIRCLSESLFLVSVRHCRTCFHSDHASTFVQARWNPSDPKSARSKGERDSLRPYFRISERDRRLRIKFQRVRTLYRVDSISNKCPILSDPMQVDVARPPRCRARKFNDLHTGIRLAVAVWSRRWCAVPGLHFQCVRALSLAIEHHLREDFTCLTVDLEVVLSLVPVAVHDVIGDLPGKGRWSVLRHGRGSER